MAVNVIGGESTLATLLDVCSYPVLQDVVGVNAWTLQEGKKDDFYIYGKDGLLAAYLGFGDADYPYLSSESGYAAMRQLILDVAAAQ